MNVWDHIQYTGDETHPLKPQYTRGVFVFVCPWCGAQISSAQYLNVGYFQIACAEHVKTLACALAQGHKELSAPSAEDDADAVPF